MIDMIDMIGNRTMPDLLAERVEQHPDAAWLVFEERDGEVSTLTYQQFARHVDRVAAGFAALGVGRGDAVVVHLRNCPEFLISWFGLAALGAVMVPSNVANTTVELEHLVTHSEAVAVVTEGDYLPLFQQLESEADDQLTLVLARTDPLPEGVIGFHSLLQTHGRAPQPELDSEDIVEMIFTSGTTAKPKAVLLTHANALHSGERIARGVGLGEGDRCLTALPVFHVNAQSVTVLAAMTAAGTCVLLEEFRASRYWEQIRRHRATQTSMVAMQVRTMLAQPPQDGDRDHSLRRVVFAINVTDAEKETFEDRFGVRFLNAYGLSEAMTLVTLSPLFGRQRWPSIGLPALGRTVRIVDPDGTDVPKGDVGEILVGGTPGRTLMKGYYRDPDATAATLRDGWLHTGDHGYADKEGYLYFFDRKKDVIKRAGENVSASEVEAALVQHPGIAEAAVIGVVDPVRDEAVKAFVVLESGHDVTIEEIRQHCAQRLASFKIPTLVEVVPDLPKTSIGKIEKKVLRAREEEFG